MNMRQACAVAAAVFGAAAWGAVITDKTGYVWLTATEENSQSSTSWNSAGKWSDNAAPSGDKDYLVQAPNGFEECFSGTTFQMRTVMDKSSEQPFAGRSLTLDDGALNLKGNTGASYPVTLVAYGCRIAHGYGGKEYILKGSLEVHGTPETPTCLTGSANAGNRVLRVQSELSGEPGTLVRVTRTLPDEPDGRTYAYRCLFESANPLYKGAFKVDRGNSTQAQAMYEVGFMVPGALGAPVAGGAKLTAENVLVHCGGAAFTNGYAVAVTGNITFNAAGGADGVCGACEPVPAPGGVSAFFGEGGSLTGDGTTAVTLQGHEGTFVFDDVALAGVASIESKPLTTVAVLPNFQPGAVPLTVAGALTGDNSSLGAVTLKAGGHLAPGVGLDGAASVGSLTMASLTMQAGTYLLYSVQDPDGTAAVFNDRIHVTGNLVNQTGGKIPVAFERRVKTFTAGRRLELLRAANLGTAGGLTADDFELLTPSAGAPWWEMEELEGTFSVEDSDGGKVLVFTCTGKRPVVLLEGQDGSTGSFAKAGFWSDGKKPDEANDYVVPDGALLRCREAGTFAGHSLTVRAGGDFAVNGVEATVNDLRLMPGGILTTRNDGSDNVIRGNATVYPDPFGTPFEFWIESANRTRELKCHLNFSGTGNLLFGYYDNASNTSADKKACTLYRILNEQPNFTGNITLSREAVAVSFVNELAMGASTPEFRQDRLTLERNATLRCERSYTICDPSRGITLGDGAQSHDGGTFAVSEGQTLTIDVPVAGASSIRKFDVGTLRLVRELAFTGFLRHKEGTVEIAHPRALARGKVEIFTEGVWCIDTPEGMTLSSLAPDVIKYTNENNPRFRIWPGVFKTWHPFQGTVTPVLLRIGGVGSKSDTPANRQRLVDQMELVLDNKPKGCTVSELQFTENDANELLVTCTIKPVGCYILVK